MKTPNPPCRCGCGHEVALPWNKFIQGHANAIRLSVEQRRELEKMLADGVPSYKIGAKFGRSAATVMQWRERGVPEQQPATNVVRREDLISAMRIKARRKD